MGEGDVSCVRKVRVHVGGGLASRGALGFGVDMPFFLGDDDNCSGRGCMLRVCPGSLVSCGGG